MKKKLFAIGEPSPILKQFLRVMKLSIFFLVVASLHLSASVYSQNEILTLKMEKVSVKEVLSIIESQTDLTFFYQEEQLASAPPVTINEIEQSVDVILARVFEKSSLDFRIVDKHVVIFPAAKPEVIVQQQGKTITGRVVGANGEPIPGATIVVKGTTTGTITDMDGNFSLAGVPEDALLQFSFVGMKSVDVDVSGQQEFKIVLQEEMLGLDEVVVVGYGVQKKSDLTGAVASVKGEELSKVTVTNAAEALQGRIAGVSVTSIGGTPGGEMEIKIRGASTMNQNNPLVIIDGVPGSLSMLNSSDIASVEVLKDGAAAAIYGTEAANGVILVTTKRGAEGKLTINATARYAVQTPTSNLDMANKDQYLKVANMLYENAGQTKPQYLNETYTTDTDWVDEIFRTAPLQDYNVSFSGGTQKSRYYLSVGYINQDGTAVGSDYQKASLRSKIDFEGEWLKGGFNLSYNETDRDRTSMFFLRAYQMLPIVPVYDETKPDGFGYPDETKGMPENNNPIGREHFNNSTYSQQYFSAVSYLTFDIVKGLNFRFEAGLNNNNNHSFLHHPSYNINPKDEVVYPAVNESRANWREYNINNILNYNLQVNDHKFDIMTGYVLKKETNEWMDAGVTGFKKIYNVQDGNIVTEEVPTGFLDEYFDTLDAGQDGEKTVGGSRTIYTRASILGRINYSYKDRYLLQATVRRDGSSKFGPDSRYGTFPSVALGWRVSEEEFMKGSDLFSNLKLRGSYGVLGNENSLGLYEYMALMTTSTTEYLSYSKGRGEAVWVGTIARDLQNREYRWETTESINVGLDLGFANNRLTGSVNYYNNKTTDMLVKKPIPPSAGLNTPKVNFGEMKNTGVEFELNYQNNLGELEYSVFAAFSTTDNEVTKLGYSDESIPGWGLKYGTEHFVNQTRVGYPVGAFFVYQTDGIFQSPEEVEAHNSKGAEGEPLQPNAAPGDIRFKDVNNDGVLNDKDKVFSGTPIPKYDYSLSLDATYRGFDFTLQLHGAGGHKIYNGTRYYFESMLAPRNFLASTANAWTPQNKQTDMPRAILGDPNQNSRESTRFVEDGDFLRVKNLQLGYTLPQKWTHSIKMNKVRLYMSGQNLLTFTKYSGQDPEIGTSEVLDRGLDTAIYPISKMYVFGIQISL